MLEPEEGRDTSALRALEKGQGSRLARLDIELIVLLKAELLAA